MSDEKNKILSMFRKNPSLSVKEVATTLNFSIRKVSAIRAHITMGTYDKKNSSREDRIKHGEALYKEIETAKQKADEKINPSLSLKDAEDILFYFKYTNPCATLKNILKTIENEIFDAGDGELYINGISFLNALQNRSKMRKEQEEVKEIKKGEVKMETPKGYNIVLDPSVQQVFINIAHKRNTTVPEILTAILTTKVKEYLEQKEQELRKKLINDMDVDDLM